MGGKAFKGAKPVLAEDLPTIISRVKGFVRGELDTLPWALVGNTGRASATGDVDIAIEGDGALWWPRWKAYFQRQGVEVRNRSILVGTAQVDFMFGPDLELLKFFYQSVPSDSMWTAADRNELWQALAKARGFEKLSPKTGLDGVHKDPASIVRALLGPAGTFADFACVGTLDDALQNLPDCASICDQVQMDAVWPAN